jgi:hypothetical protein
MAYFSGASRSSAARCIAPGLITTAGAIKCIEGRVAYGDVQHAGDPGVSGLVMGDGLFLLHDDKLR